MKRGTHSNQMTHSGYPFIPSAMPLLLHLSELLRLPMSIIIGKGEGIEREREEW